MGGAKGKTKSRAPRRRVKRRGGAQTLVNSSSLSPVPSRFITKMKYAEAVTLSGTGMRTYVWNLNSLFDPNRTGTGHQPYGFDQLCGAPGASLYNRYRVFRCDYVLTVANDDYNIHYAVLPSNEVPPINNVSEARETPRCQYAVQNPGGTLKRITGSVSLPALMGRTKEQYMASPDYSAQYNANPFEMALLNCYSQGLNDDAGVPMSHTFNILLTYHVEFFDPHVLDQS